MFFYLLFEVGRSLLLERGGHRDRSNDSHAVPLFGVLPDMKRLGGEVLVVLPECHVVYLTLL